MLDAYIIDRIRREREARESFQLPLHIEIPPPEPPRYRPPEDEREEEGDDGQRGVVIVDFTI
jgi:hypothetical protein